MDERFTDRTQAGHRLAKALAHLAGTPDLLVLGLPRGGVVVAAPVAAALAAPLDILVVAKAGVPWQPELALGAVSADGHRVVNEDVVRRARLGSDEVDASLAAATGKAAHRAESLRGGRPPIDLTDRVVVLVDDGLATGATARAAVDVARGQGAARVVLAVPVAPADTVNDLRSQVDELVVLSMPRRFDAVGSWYDDFTQTTDLEVRNLLESTGTN